MSTSPPPQQNLRQRTGGKSKSEQKDEGGLAQKHTAASPSKAHEVSGQEEPVEQPCPLCGMYEGQDPDPECNSCGGAGVLKPRVKRQLPPTLEKYFEKRKKALIEKGIMTKDGKFDKAMLEKLDEQQGSISTRCKIDLVMFFFLFSVLALVFHFKYRINLPKQLTDFFLWSLDPGEIRKPK